MGTWISIGFTLKVSAISLKETISVDARALFFAVTWCFSAVPISSLENSSIWQMTTLQSNRWHSTLAWECKCSELKNFCRWHPRFSRDENNIYCHSWQFLRPTKPFENLEIDSGGSGLGALETHCVQNSWISAWGIICQMSSVERRPFFIFLPSYILLPFLILSEKLVMFLFVIRKRRRKEAPAWSCIGEGKCGWKGSDHLYQLENGELLVEPTPLTENWHWNTHRLFEVPEDCWKEEIS